MIDGIDSSRTPSEDTPPTTEEIQPAIETPQRKRLPRRFFIIMACLALAAVGAGAAGPAVADNVGQLMDSDGEGTAANVATTVEQALGVMGGSVTEADAGRVIVSDDGTAFKAPVQANIGDKFNINLALVNKSDQPLDLQIDIDTPGGLTATIQGNDGASGVVQSDINSWVFTLAANEGNETTDLAITIAVDDLIQPGNYVLDCVIEPVTF